jgi:hypothetical protein
MSRRSASSLLLVAVVATRFGRSADIGIQNVAETFNTLEEPVP